MPLPLPDKKSTVLRSFRCLKHQGTLQTQSQRGSVSKPFGGGALIKGPTLPHFETGGLGPTIKPRKYHLKYIVPILAPVTADDDR